MAYGYESARADTYTGSTTNMTSNAMLAVEPGVSTSPVASRLGELQKSLAWLQHGIDNMTGKIAPVLRPERPEVAANKPERDSANGSSLSAALSETVQRVEMLARRVEALVERVEL